MAMVIATRQCLNMEDMEYHQSTDTHGLRCFRRFGGGNGTVVTEVVSRMKEKNIRMEAEETHRMEASLHHMDSLILANG